MCVTWIPFNPVKVMRCFGLWHQSEILIIKSDNILLILEEFQKENSRSNHRRNRQVSKVLDKWNQFRIENFSNLANLPRPNEWFLSLNQKSLASSRLLLTTLLVKYLEGNVFTLACCCAREKCTLIIDVARISHACQYDGIKALMCRNIK